MVDLEGPVLSAAERDLLRHPQVGGVILFSRNFASAQQLGELVAEIHALRDPHLLVAVDQEGGRVQRFRAGFTELPAPARIGQVAAHSRGRARWLAELYGWLMAAELRAVGIDLSFAPVLDLDHGLSSVIGERAFHRHPGVVADLAHRVMAGMLRAGMAPVGKHYPGHGGVSADSHLELPMDDRPLDAIREADIVPFERMVDYGLPGIMASHVAYRRVDAAPASFSTYWLRHVLRGRLGFRGAIFSDDLSMQAAAATVADPGGRAAAALEAGCDMVLVCNDRAGAEAALDAAGAFDDPVSQVRLARMHGRHGMDPQALHRSPAWHHAVNALAALAGDRSLEMGL